MNVVKVFDALYSITPMQLLWLFIGLIFVMLVRDLIYQAGYREGLAEGAKRKGYRL